MSAKGTRIKCSGCGKRIPNSEPDIVLHRDGSEKLRYFHQTVGCIDKLTTFLEGQAPDVWHVMVRSVSPELN